MLDYVWGAMYSREDRMGAVRLLMGVRSERSSWRPHLIIRVTVSSPIGLLQVQRGSIQM